MPLKFLIVSMLVSACSGQISQPARSAAAENVDSSRRSFAIPLAQLSSTSTRMIVILIRVSPLARRVEPRDEICDDQSASTFENLERPITRSAIHLEDPSNARVRPITTVADDSDSRGTVSVPIPMNDVTGLVDALSQINNSISNLTITVNNLSTTVNSLSSTVQSLGPLPTFVDAETPIGAIDGANATFTLGAAPSPQSSLVLYRNGMRLSQGIDYSLTGNTILFSTPAIPQPSDFLLAGYRH